MLQQAINRLTSEVVSVPTEVAKSALHRAVKDFAYHTGVIEHEELVTLNAEQSEYALDIPSDNRLALIEGVFLDGFPRRSVDGFNPPRRHAPGVAFRVKTYVPPVLWIGNIGASANGKEVTVASRLEPATLEAVPENVWAKYGDAVHLGALSILYRMPSRPWSAPAYGTQYGAAYVADRARARQERARGGSQHDYPVRAPKITRR